MRILISLIALSIIILIPQKSYSSRIPFHIERNSGITYLEMTAGETEADSVYHQVFPVIDGDIFCVESSENCQVEMSSVLKMRDLEFSVLSIIPEPGLQTGDLVRVELSGGSENEISFHKPAGSFLRMYTALFPELAERENWRDIETAQPSILYIYPDTAEPAFWSVFNYLLEWKKQKGFKVYEYATNTTSSTVIKDYIQDAYDTWEEPPEYICLIGDAGGDFSIPSTFCSDGAGDHYYTTLAGDDQISDVHIGRLSFNNISEWQTIVYKITTYEREPYMGDTGWYNRILLTGDPNNLSGISCVYTNINIRELITNNHSNYVFTEIYDPPFSANMQNGINAGVSYFNYRGFWGMSGWNVGTAEGLNNGMMLPFAVISTCATGDFYGEGACRSESFIRAGTTSNPRGGIGAIGTATTETHTCFNNCFAMGVAYGLYVEDLRTMGASHTRGKTSLWLNYPQNPDNSATKFSYWNNLIGDPSIEVWIKEPGMLTILGEEYYSQQMNSITIRALNEYGYGVNGLFCCLYNAPADEQFFCFSNEDGFATLPIAGMNTGEYTLTVSGKNFYPFQDTLILESSIDLMIEDIVFHDNNENGGFEPGESGEIVFTLTNSGESAVLNIEISILNYSDEVEIENGEINVTSLEAGEEVIIDDIGITCHSINNDNEQLLGFQVSSENHSFTDTYLLPLTPLVLNLNNYSFMDNNNNLPESGETVLLFYELENTGEAAINGLSLELSARSNLLQIAESTFNLGDIEQGEIYEAVEPFTLEIAEEYISGNNEIFTLRLTSPAGFRQDIEFEQVIGESGISSPTGPDAGGYCIYDVNDSLYSGNLPLAYEWIPIQSSPSLPFDDWGDEGSICQRFLPFNFRFYGQDYDVITICSNGWVAPGYTESASFMNWAIPGEGGISPIIAVFWDDLVTWSNGNAHALYQADEHRAVIEWYHLKNDWDNSYETFELIIYDREYYPTSNGNNMLKMQYQDFNNVNEGNYHEHPGGNHGQYATIGIENQTGTQGLQYTYNNEYPVTATPLSDCSALVIAGEPVPANVPWLVLEDSYFYNRQGDEIISPGDTINVVISIQNIGDQSSDMINIELISENLSGMNFINNSLILNSINSGDIMEGITGISFVLDENFPPLESLIFTLKFLSNGKLWKYYITREVTAPLIRISQEIDFGKVVLGVMNDLVVEIENRGTAPLEIFDIYASCEELTVDFLPVVLESGGTCEITLSYLSDVLGDFQETITITSNSFINDSFVAPVIGQVVNPAEIVLEQDHYYFEVEEGDYQEYAINISNEGEGDLEITSRLEGFYNSGYGGYFAGGFLECSQPIITGEEFSIECWARMDGDGFQVSGDNALFSQRDNEVGDSHAAIVLLSENTSGNTYLALRGAESSGIWLITAAPTRYEWHHYVVTISENFVQLYIDGELRISDVHQESGGYFSGVNFTLIGAHKYDNILRSSFNGVIDEIRFWDRALNAEEILDHQYHSVDLDSEGLTAYWTFNEMNNWQDLVNDDIVVTPQLEVSQDTSEAPINDWSSLGMSNLVISGGESAILPLRIDASYLELGGEYETDLILETNDPEAGNITVPIVVTVVPVAENENEIPVCNILMQNYPNPFYSNNNDREATVIEYSLLEEVKQAEIIIYNIKGQKVKGFSLDPDKSRKGMINWDGCNKNDKHVGSGVYCYILKTDGKLSSQRKMLLLH
ncbi:MAG: DUF1573 domain-containing protein [Candidatus Cloacimonetes bacterium]|nr:DUF1573 domain-containing protein [Candidatus Cloacimonadota bacterium]